MSTLDASSSGNGSLILRDGDVLEVVRALDRALEHRGPLTFADFMEIVLYTPEHGYYGRAASRPERDYITSPRVHPLFGALLTLQLEQMWHILDCPSRFTVLEVGAANGGLARAIIDYSRDLDSNFHSALDYVVVERHYLIPSCRLGLPTRVHSVVASAAELPFSNLVGCILSNELIDALPVHRVVSRDGLLREAYVCKRHGVLSFSIAPVSTSALYEYFGDLEMSPSPDCLVEVNLSAPRFITQAARALRRGFVLTIDYGCPAEELYSDRRTTGTLRCYSRHQQGDDPFLALGNQDITTHVDFSTLVLSGRKAGLLFTGLVSQREFLFNLGHEAFIRQLEVSNMPGTARYQNKFAIGDLVSTSGLGAFRVLVQHKGIADPDLDGFNVCNDRRRRLLSGSLELPLPIMN